MLFRSSSFRARRLEFAAKFRDRTIANEDIANAAMRQLGALRSVALEKHTTMAERVAADAELEEPLADIERVNRLVREAQERENA